MTIKQLKKLLRWLPKNAVIIRLSENEIIYSISENESYKIEFPKTKKFFEKPESTTYNIKDDKDK
jgi:hypothetical protein